MGDLKNKIILTCALTGVLTDPKKYPVPVTPAEIAAEARRAADAGATIVHVHFRNQAPGQSHLPTWEPDVVASIVDAIKKEVPEIVINMSTGTPGKDISGPLACLRRCKPEMAALSVGSLNYLKATSDGKWAWPPHTFDNSVEKITEYLDVMNECKVVPECECFDVGIVRSVALFEKVGLMKRPFHYSFVMGVASGMPADPDLLPFLQKYIVPGSRWQTIVIGREDVWKVHRRAAELGGHVRTGLEDTFYLPSGKKATSNGPLIESLAKIVREVGREPTTFAETRKILAAT